MNKYEGLTVSKWIRAKVANGEIPRIQGAENDSDNGNNENGNTDSSSDNSTEETPEQKLAKLELTDEQRKAFGNIMSEARKKARAAGKKEAEDEATAAANQARKDAETEASKKAGKFEEVETQLRSEIEAEKANAKTAKEELTTANERIEALNAAILVDLKPRWDALPEEVRDLFQGDENDSLAKLEYLNKDSVKKLANVNGNSGNRTNPPNPKNGDSSRTDAEAARVSQGMVYKNY